MNAHIPSALIAAVIAYSIGALSPEDVNATVGILVAVTGLFVGAARYIAVLRGDSTKTVERATAIGFFLGLGISVALVIFLLLLTYT